jgi:hypothetical protein
MIMRTKIKCLYLLALFVCALLPAVVESRYGNRGGGIVHDVVDDYDRDEFEDLNAEDEEEETDIKEVDHHEVEGEGEGEDEDEDEDEDEREEDMVEIEIDNNDWSNDEFGDDEFNVPTIKNKREKNKNKIKKRKGKGKGKGKHSSEDYIKRADSSPSSSSKLEPRSYFPEYVAMGMIIIYAMLYFIGSSQNEQKATKFIESLYPLIRDQFYTVGELTMTATDDNESLTTWEARKLLTKESQSQYRLFATGRQYVKGMIVNVNLLNRQDLIYSVLNVLQGNKDMVSLEIPMNETYMAPFVMAIVPAKDTAKVKNENNDIEALTTGK